MSSPTFNEHDKKYLCFCRSIHVHFGAVLFTSVALSFVILLAIFVNLKNDYEFKNDYVCYNIILFAYISISIFALYGMRNNSPSCLVPLIIWDLIIILVCAYIFVVFGSEYKYKQATVSYTSLKNSRYYEEDPVMPILVMMISMAILIWKASVLIRCFNFLSDRKNAAAMFLNPSHEKLIGQNYV